MRNWKRDLRDFGLVNGAILGLVCLALLVFALPDLVGFNGFVPLEPIRSIGPNYVQ